MRPLSVTTSEYGPFVTSRVIVLRQHPTELQGSSGSARETLKNKLVEHRIYIRSHGEDMPEIRSWQWAPATGPEVRTQQAELHTPAG